VVVARGVGIAGLGVDIEPAEKLPDPAMVPLIASPSELSAFHDVPVADKVLFSIKEAVFKAVNPCDGIFLDFGDISVDRGSFTATTRSLRKVHWRLVAEPRILVIAWW